MADEGDPVDLDAVAARLRRRVAERRAAGEYPDDLEEVLDAQFRALVAQREEGEWPGEAVESELAGLAAAGRFGRERIDLGGGPVAKRYVHRLAGLLVTRQVQGVLAQAQGFADAVRSTLARQWEAVRHLDRRQSLLEQRLESALDKLARYERGEGPPGIVAKELREGLGELRRWRRATELHPWYSSTALALALGGDRGEVKQAYAALVARFEEGPVVDVGCGRGEALELLAERGIEAAGVDPDETLVEEACRRGLAASVGDGVAALAERDDASLGGVFLGHVVERLAPQQVVDVVGEAARALRPGGLLVARTVNPRSLRAHAGALYRGPIPARPVDPDYLVFLCGAAGFAGIEVEPPAVAPDGSCGPEGAAGTEGVAASLLGPPDYDLVARR